MKKIGRAITKFLGIVILLLILITIGIFSYPKFAAGTDIDDKVVSFLAEHAPNPTAESDESGNNMGEEVGVGVSGNDITSDIVLPEEEVEVQVKDDSRTQTWSEDEKKALKTAYNTVLHKMGLAVHNLLFYEMKNIDGDTYYSFQVVDDFGNAYEDILLYDPDNNNVYWHNKKGNLDYAYSTDSIYSGKVEGNENVEYKDESWKPVMIGYLDAMLKDRDNEKASTYVDSSCYYLAKLSELNRDSYVDATIENQEFLIEEAIDVESRKKAKTIDSYEWSYKIYDKEEFIDEYNLDWIEVYIKVDLDISSDEEEDHYRNYYCVHLREYEYGWRVAAFTKE